MIVAVGLDLVELWRIRRSLERFPDRFVARVFHPGSPLDEISAYITEATARVRAARFPA